MATVDVWRTFFDAVGRFEDVFGHGRTIWGRFGDDLGTIFRAPPQPRVDPGLIQAYPGVDPG